VKLRNCAWRDDGVLPSSTTVWARGGVGAFHCPKSIITAQSLHFVEQFHVWKKFGGGAPWLIDAKVAEAILVLEEAWRKENQRGEKEE
jgi:hypothetical protein